MKQKANRGKIRDGFPSFKLLRVIALTSVLLFHGFVEASAFASYAQLTTVTVKSEGASIKDVLLDIEDNTEFFFLYNNELVDVESRVNVEVKDAPILGALKEIFEGQKVEFTVMDRQIIISPEKEVPQAQETKSTTMSGVVKDDTGEPLPGVTVMVKGSGTGTITDVEGAYSLANVKVGDVLLFSFIGMQPTEVKVTGQKVIDVLLKANAIGLDEIVAVGYATQKRSHITGSVASVDAEKLTKVPATNTSSMLAGRLPGMIVTNNSGQPGRDEADISIRGFGSALVIVDGIPRDFQQLDPNEIESISILKDASAAVYGARAGNGVILVTTKRGSRDSAPVINYSGSMSYQRPTFMPERANAPQYAEYYQQAEAMAGILPENYTYSDEEIEKYKAGTEPGYRGANWQDIVLRDWAPMNQHNVNVSGGTDKVNYFVSLGSLKQNSFLATDAGVFKRYNISSNVDVNVSEKLKLGLNMKYRIEDRDNPGGRDPGQGDEEYQRIFRYFISAKPTVEPIPNEPDLMAYVSEAYQNPLAHARTDISGFNKDKRKQFDMIFNMGYELPIEGLSVDGRVALKHYDRLSREIKNPYTVYRHDYETGENIAEASLVENSVEVINWKYDQLTTQFALKYNKQIGDHKIDAMGLAEYLYIDKYEFGAQRKDLISLAIPYLYSGNGVQTNYDNPEENGRQSFVGRVNYNYKEKYLLELLFRADASIKFPEDNRWGYFPGVTMGWRMSEEEFLKKVDAVENLKLRASFASLGYDAISQFDYLTGYELVGDYRYGYGGLMNEATLQSVGEPNSMITWESMDIYNVGVDVSLWQGLLGAEFDAFYRYRSGLLLDRMSTIPSTVGANLPKENIGKRDNRGFELVLNHNHRMGDFRYNISGNVTWTREKYVYQEEREFDASDPDDARLNQKTGEWVNRTFGYVTDGFYDTQAEIDGDNLTYPELGEPVLGDIKYVDQNGDGIINYRDQKVIGRGNTPELFYGLNMDAQYKGFDFSMLWQGAANYDILIPRNFEAAPNLSIGQVPYEYQVENAWNAASPADAKLPAPSLGGTNTHNAPASDLYLRKGQYIRLKTINLGYTLPQAITQRAKISSVRFYVAAYNLLTIMPNDVFKFDPESRGGDAISTYPVQQTFTLGVNVKL